MAVHQSSGLLHVLTQAIPGFLGLNLRTDVQLLSRNKLDYAAGLSPWESGFLKDCSKNLEQGLQDGRVKLRKRRIIFHLPFGEQNRFESSIFLGRESMIGHSSLPLDWKNSKVTLPKSMDIGQRTGAYFYNLLHSC